MKTWIFLTNVGAFLLLQCVDLLHIYFDTLGYDDHIKIFDFFCGKFAFINIYLQTLLVQTFQYLQHMTSVVFFVFAVEKHVIQVCHTKNVEVFLQ